MVQTRSQLEHPSKDKLVEELMSIEDMSSKMASLRTWSDDFVRRFEIWDLSTDSCFQIFQLYSKWKNYPTRINRVNNAKYNRRKSIEASFVSASVSN